MRTGSRGLLVRRYRAWLTRSEEFKEMSVPDVVVRPAAAADRHHIWRLTRELAVSFVPQRHVFDASFDAVLAAPGNLLLVADSPTQAVVGYVLASHHLTFFA